MPKSVYSEIIKAANLPDFDGSQDQLRAVADAIESLDDDDWDDLSAEAQEWYNQSADAMLDDKKLPQLPGFDAKKKADKPARRRAAKAEEPVEEEQEEEQEEESEEDGALTPDDAEVGMEVTITTKRDETYAGTISKVTGSFLTLNLAAGGSERVGKNRIAEIVEGFDAEPAEEEAEEVVETVVKDTPARETTAKVNIETKVSVDRNGTAYALETLERLRATVATASALIVTLEAELGSD